MSVSMVSRLCLAWVWVAGAAAGAQEDQPGAPEPLPGTSLSQSGEAWSAPGATEGEDVNFQTFHDALAPYGHWVYTAEYGWIWQPDGEPAGWVPYSDGQWNWSAYGWTYAGVEPWGWAPYHYGRWASLNGIGWGWVPGYQWGPGWVSWRTGPSYVGWTPLWPGWSAGAGWGGWPVNYNHWCFTNYGGFYGGRLGGHLFGPAAIAGAWGASQFSPGFRINQSAYVGPRPSVVAAAGGHQVVPVALQAVNSPSQVTRAGTSGGTVAVMAPTFHGASSPFAAEGSGGGHSVSPVANLGSRAQTPASGFGMTRGVGGVAPYRGALPVGTASGFAAHSASPVQTYSNRSLAGTEFSAPGNFSTYRSPSAPAFSSARRAVAPTSQGYRPPRTTGSTRSFQSAHPAWSSGSRSFSHGSSGFSAAPHPAFSGGSHGSMSPSHLSAPAPAFHGSAGMGGGYHGGGGGGGFHGGRR